MKIDFSMLLGIVTIISITFNIILALTKNTKTDAITQGKLSNDLEYVKRGVDTVILEQKDSAREQAKLRQELTINRSETAKALEHAERAYQHAEKAHSRINKMGAN